MKGASITASRKWFIGLDVTLAVLVGAAAFVFLDVASLGILTSVVTVAGALAALGLMHYLSWGYAPPRGSARVQVEAAGQSDAGAAKAPDDFVLELNNRERAELLQLLQHSLAQSVGDGEKRGDRAAIQQELLDKVRMFGA